VKLYRWKDIKNGGFILDMKSEKYLETATRLTFWEEEGFPALAWSKKDAECWDGARDVEIADDALLLDLKDLVYLAVQIALEKAGL
jgi:hypothetical protein